MDKMDKTYFANIPETVSIWNGCGVQELREKVYRYYKDNFKGLKVQNKHIGITVVFSMASGRKTARGEAMYHKKAEIAKIIPAILENAKFNNFGARKPSDPKDVIGYLNFKGKCRLDGRIENVRIAVQFQKNAKFYYNIEVNKIVVGP